MAKPVKIQEAAILHIEIGNQSIIPWLIDNRYIIFSEMVRFSEKLIKNDLDYIYAVMISNTTENVVLIIRKDDVMLTLDKSMQYFLGEEEYEQCAKIRDLSILISEKNSEKNKPTKKHGRRTKTTNPKD